MWCTAKTTHGVDTLVYPGLRYYLNLMFAPIFKRDTWQLILWDAYRMNTHIRLWTHKIYPKFIGSPFTGFRQSEKVL